MEGWNISIKVFEKILKDSDSTWIDEKVLYVPKKPGQKERLPSTRSKFANPPHSGTLIFYISYLPFCQH